VKRRVLLGIGTLVALLGLSAWLMPRAARHSWFWEWNIRRLEARNREHPPQPGGIVFTGSSSIRLWETLDRDMAPLPVSNQGFGGAHAPHITHYAPRIVLSSKPRIVVLFVGGNDLQSEDRTAEGVAENIAGFGALVHATLPESRLFVLSLKPSPLRFSRWPEMVEANRLIAEWCAGDPRLEFVDVATPMLDAAGAPRAEIFAADRLHLNDDGYALWTALLRPRLQRAWSRLEPAP
jgi:lysophospholipase L1-like esterase